MPRSFATNDLVLLTQDSRLLAGGDATLTGAERGGFCAKNELGQNCEDGARRGGVLGVGV